FMSRKTIILFIVFLILFLAFSFGAGFKVGSRSRGTNKNLSADTFHVGWDAAKKRLADSKFSPIMREGSEVKNINGTVTEIKD
ncbi:hypothetical protein, partial [Pseudomonas aeruginosa]|uniref:hypothetical protein n=1 Tax=Pseudomonas aeruginosa TaxID=287 RepID=UPI0034591CD1